MSVSSAELLAPNSARLVGLSLPVLFTPPIIRLPFLILLPINPFLDKKSLISNVFTLFDHFDFGLLRPARVALHIELRHWRELGGASSPSGISSDFFRFKF